MIEAYKCEFVWFLPISCVSFSPLNRPIDFRDTHQVTIDCTTQWLAVLPERERIRDLKGKRMRAKEARKCRYQRRRRRKSIVVREVEGKLRVERANSRPANCSFTQLLAPVCFVLLTKWRIRKSFSRKLSLAFPARPHYRPIVASFPSDHRRCFISFSDGSQKQKPLAQQFDKSIGTTSTHHVSLHTSICIFKDRPKEKRPR